MSDQPMDAESLDALRGAAVGMLDPVMAAHDGHAAAWPADLAQRVDRCAALAGTLGLREFAGFAENIAARLRGLAADARALECAERWVGAAIAFCGGQMLRGEEGLLVEAGDGWPAAEAVSVRPDPMRLAAEAERIARFDESAAPARAVAARDEMQMLAHACDDLEQDLAESAPGARPELLAERMHNIGNALEFMGLAPAAALVRRMAACARAELDQAHADALASWPRRWAAWFRAPAPTTLQQALELHDMRAWSDPAALERARLFLGGLELVASRQIPTRAERFDADDLSLAIPADADQEVVGYLLRELPQLSEQFSAAVLAVGAGQTVRLAEARRIAHTLKGSANTVGIRGVANLTHVLEDLLQLLEQGASGPDPQAVELLCDAADCLSEMIESVASQQPAPPAAAALYADLIRAINRLTADPAEPAGVDGDPIHVRDADAASDTRGSPDASAAPDPAGSSTEIPVGTDRIDGSAVAPTPEADRHADADLPDQGPAELPDALVDESSLATTTPAPMPLRAVRNPDEMLRVPAAVIERLLEAASEAVIGLSQLQEAMRGIDGARRALHDSGDRLASLASELDRLVDAGPAERAGRRGNEAFDSLEMERYTELHTVSRRITEVGADGKLIERQIGAEGDRVHRALAHLERVQSEIREAALRARMVEAETIVPRLQRAARQAARLAGKSVELVFAGGQTAVDASLLQRLLEPLSHLVRNAVDHGIEMPADRLQAGKPAAGRIDVSVAREAASVTVEVCDDGAGLDLEAIAGRARELGLVGPGDAVDARTAAQLILAPGFSTRRSATQLSGRGIGLDVVAQAVRALRGSITVVAEPGHGSRFELILPLQMTTLSVFVLRSPSHVLAVSVRGVERIVSMSDAVVHAPDGPLLRQGEQWIPLVRLDEALGLPPGMLAAEGCEEGEGEVAMLVREPGGTMTALVVPEPGQTRQVVVRPLPDWLPMAPGIDGVAILGDGAVATVLDLPEVVATSADARPDPRAHLHRVEHLPVCLVVDDSVSVRRTMEQFVRDLGLEADSAADGIEALARVQRRIPDLAIVDLEMPRMNGIELTRALRADERCADLPIIMITSRHTERHRDLAMQAGVDVFLTKPYTEDRLATQIAHCLARAAPSADSFRGVGATPAVGPGRPALTPPGPG